MGVEEAIEGASSLYVIEDGEAKKFLPGLTLSNGMDWSKNGQIFYHIDTLTNTV